MGPVVVPIPTKPSKRETTLSQFSPYAWAAKEYAAVFIMLDEMPKSRIRHFEVTSQSIVILTLARSENDCDY